MTTYVFQVGDIVEDLEFGWGALEVRGVNDLTDGFLRCSQLSGNLGEGLFNAKQVKLLQAVNPKQGDGWEEASKASVLADLQPVPATRDIFPVDEPIAENPPQKSAVVSRMQYDNSSARRKDQPVYEGVLCYMPAAIRLAADLSRLGNEKHNPGEPLHHARGKSNDHLDCAARHIMDADQLDENGLIEAVAAFWRIGVYIQEQCETKYGWPRARNAKE